MYNQKKNGSLTSVKIYGAIMFFVQATFRQISSELQISSYCN